MRGPITWARDRWRAVRGRSGASGLLANGSLYQSAGGGYRVRGWSAPSTGPTATIVRSGPELRNRSRAEFRNNAWARSIADVLVTNLTGTGFTPHPLFGSGDEGGAAERSAAWARDARNWWRRWGKRADADGGCFEGILATAVRGMVEAGDSFIVRAGGESAGISLRLRVLEAEMVPLWKNETLGPQHVIRAGIEFLQGDVVAYWMYQEHPGEFTSGLSGSTELRRVPAAQVLHLFRRLRPGQVRGEPWFASVLLRLHDVGGYFDAECFRKKGAANFVFKCEAPDPDKVSDAIGEIHNAAAQDGETDTKPGSVVVTGVGETFDLVQPADVGPNFTPFVTWVLREICAGPGVPYALATGDMSQETYTSHRAALLEFWRKCDAIQYAAIVPILNTLWAWWIDELAVSGVLPMPRFVAWREDYRDCEWVPPGRDWIDPAKEVAAKAEELALQITSKTRICAARGENFADLVHELAEEKRLLEAAGLDAVLPERKPAAPARQADKDPPVRRTGTDG